MNARVDHAVTSGTFSLDGQTFDVDNNVWVVGDDAECVVLDAPHNVAAILDVVGDRTVRAIIATHAHDDHVRVAPELAQATGAPILLHPADLPVWRLTHPRVDPDGELADGQDIVVGGTTLRVLHTPGHSTRVMLPARGRPAGGVHRRHPVRRRPGRDRPLVQRLRHDHRAPSARSCSPCPRTPPSIPGTATAAPSPTRRPTCGYLPGGRPPVPPAALRAPLRHRPYYRPLAGPEARTRWAG